MDKYPDLRKIIPNSKEDDFWQALKAQDMKILNNNDYLVKGNCEIEY